MGEVSRLNNSQENMTKRQTGIFCLLLIAAVVALYGQFLSNPIVFDDVYFFLVDEEGNQPVSSLVFSPFQLRSLPYATLAWTNAWFGLDLMGFRIGNLLLHAAAVLALFFFLLNLFATVFEVQRQEGLSHPTAAFFAALLFALHPVATYAAGYLVQRTTVMATAFSLLSMLAYVHGSLRQTSGALWMSVPFYFLAVTAKEHAIMLPAVLLALTALLHDDWRTKIRQRWEIFACLAVIAAFAVLAKRNLLGSVYEIQSPDMFHQNEGGPVYPMSVLTQCWLFFKYALMWVLPNPAWMSIDMREPFAQSLLSPYLIAAAGFLAWGAGACWLLFKRGRTGLVGFALLFPWLMFFTEFASVRIQDTFVLYRSYLWAAGAFCLLPMLFAKMGARPASTILTVIALTLFPLSMGRLQTFSHPVLLWDDAEKLVKGRPDLPGASRIYYNRGTEMLRIDRLDQAVADLKQSIALTPNLAEAHGNLGAAYFKKEDWASAVESFSAAIEVTRVQGRPVIPRHFYGRAQAYEKLGEIQKANEDYKTSCELIKRGCEKLPPQGS